MSPKHDITGSNHLPGGLVITPFLISNRDDNLTILVNRGYVPFTHYIPTWRLEGQIDSEDELMGLLRKNEIISRFTPMNKPEKSEWHLR